MPARRHRHQIALQDAAGGVRGEPEAVLQAQAVGARQGGQDALLRLLVEVFEDVDRIVAVEVGQRQGDVLRLEGLDDLFPDRDVQVGEHFEVEVGPQHPYELPALHAIEVLQQEIGRASCGQRVCQYV